MKRALTAPLLNLGLRLFDDTASQETIYVRIEQTLNNYLAEPPVAALLAPLYRAYQAAQKLPLQLSNWSLPIPPNPIIDYPQAEIEKSLRNLQGTRLIKFKTITPKSGLFLLALQANPLPQYAELYQDSIERVLRQIEVHRKNALQHPKEMRYSQTSVHKHYFSILLSYETQKTGDLRFLNAALKLNDWNFNQPMNPWHLLALAEAEAILQTVSV